MSINQPGDVTIIAPGSVPGDAAPFTRAASVLGGYVAVVDVTERNAIPTSSRKQGMLVRTNDGTFHILGAGLTNSDWSTTTLVGPPGPAGAPAASVHLCSAAALPTNARTGNVITASANGALTVDGVAVAVNDRLLLKDETTAVNNGLYSVTATGSGGAPYVLTRTSDTIFSGMLVSVTAGGQAGKIMMLTTADPIVVNTTSLTYVVSSGGGGSASDIAPVLCAALGNLTLSGEQTLDGITTSASRVLVPFQTVATQNGIYVTAAGAWVRASDQNLPALFRPAAFFQILSGTVLGGKLAKWHAPTDGSLPTIGTSNIAYDVTGPLPGSYAVDDTTARDAILPYLRRQGLKVHLNNGDEYVLGAGLTNSDWIFVNYASPFTTLQNLGGGFDGDIAIATSGVTTSGPGTAYTVAGSILTLTRDLCARNVTISGTGVVVAGDFKIFCTGILDLTAASAGAIQFNGPAGGDGVLDVAPIAVSGAPPGTMGGSSSSLAGKAGGTGVGTAGAPFAPQQFGNGGISGVSGNGGSGGSGAGGAFYPPVGLFTQPTYRWATDCYLVPTLAGASVLGGGATGACGGAGAGDGTNKGGASGNAGCGGGNLFLSVNTIARGAGTAASAIQCKGGKGGKGGNGAATGNTGGGGGGPGGGGGWVRIFYLALSGTPVTGLIDASGGTGGDGGDGHGTGIGGQGGGGGDSGRVDLGNMTSGVLTETTTVTGASPTSGSGVTHGNGGTGGSLLVTL